MKTLKCYELIHVVQTIRQDESVEFASAGIFEDFHKLFVNYYRHVPKKRGAAMDETLSPVSMEAMSAYSARQNISVKIRNKNRIECVAHYQIVFVAGYSAATSLQMQ